MSSRVIRQKRRAIFWEINSETDYRMTRVREVISRTSGFKGKTANRDILDYLADAFLRGIEIADVELIKRKPEPPPPKPERKIFAPGASALRNSPWEEEEERMEDIRVALSG